MAVAVANAGLSSALAPPREKEVVDGAAPPNPKDGAVVGALSSDFAGVDNPNPEKEVFDFASPPKLREGVEEKPGLASAEEVEEKEKAGAAAVAVLLSAVEGRPKEGIALPPALESPPVVVLGVEAAPKVGTPEEVFPKLKEEVEPVFAAGVAPKPKVEVAPPSDFAAPPKEKEEPPAGAPKLGAA